MLDLVAAGSHSLTRLQLTACRGSTSFTTHFFSSLFSRLTQWFADAGNGIGKIFAKELVAENGKFKTLTTDRLCVGVVCVTQDQFMSVFGGSALAQTRKRQPSSHRRSGW